MRRAIAKLLLALFIAVATAHVTGAQAEGGFDSSRFESGSYLTPHIRIYEQKPEEQGSQPDFAKILSLAKEPTQKVPAYSYTPSVLWVLLPVQNPSAQAKAWILEVASSGLDHIDVYSLKGASPLRLYSTGDRVPFSTRSVQYPSFFFQLTEHAQSASRYLLRIQSTSSIAIPLRAWTVEGLASRTSVDGAITGLFYGALFTLALLNLVIWLNTRDRTYFFYILFLFSSVLFQLSDDGVGFQYVWPSLTNWNSRAAMNTGLLSMLTGAQFIRAFLDLRARNRALDKGFIAVIACCAAALCVGPFVQYRTIIYPSLAIAAGWVVLAVTAGFIAIRRGYSAAKWYVACWYLLFTGIAVYILRMADLVPWNSLTNSAVKIGTFLEASAMSLALGQRIRLMRQQHAFERGQRLIAEAEASLAAQVAHDIRSPLAALSVIEQELGSVSEETRALFRSANQRIREIASQMLSRQRRTRSALASEPISELVDELVREKAAQYRNAPGLELIAPDPQQGQGLFVRVERVEFFRILSNLIDNAVESLEGKPGTVRITLGEGQERLRLSIADTGKGIPSELLSRLGTRGVTFGKPNGTGLGLAHAREKLASWRGSLQIASQPGRGTTVTLELPIA